MVSNPVAVSKLKACISPKMKIGVVGYSSSRFDHDVAEQLLASAFDILTASVTDSADIEIISGLTNVGIPKIAYELADQRGFATVGISAAQAFIVHCGVYPVSRQIIHGERFGDESQLFVEYIEYLVRVGGGRQSHNEVKLFAEKCAALGWQQTERLIEHELP